MCKISDKIKFCTCHDIEDIDELETFWALYRYVKDKRVHIVGMPSLPSSFSDKHYFDNIFTIGVRLNEVDAFDKPFTFKKKDRFELVISNSQKNEEQRLEYAFEYDGQTWRHVEYDPFDLLNNYDEMAIGAVEE